MKQATLKAAGTVALGVAVAAVAAGSASAAASGGLGLPTSALGDTGSLTSSLNKAPAVGGPVSQTTGMLNPNAGSQAPASAEGQAAERAVPAGATRGLPVGAVQGAVSKAPVAGALGSLVPVGGGLPIGG
ncbi:hypothetical protein GCM10009665_12920 [Kitasatospora nipponensis]|uniref:ATP-binding protein n=1 Tax=Kitasatospora nipponensis TaxID=258049 RepID=A0ABN1VUV4_9ACTN